MTRARLVLAAICTVAASGAEVHWSDLPKVLKGKTIEVAMKSGEVHRGRFVGTREDAIILKEGQKLEISRMAIAALWRELRLRPQSHLGQFADEIGEDIGYEVIFLRTPYFPWFLVAIPVTAAIGVAGVPICAIWDLLGKRTSHKEIVIIPDLERLVH
jgi:hypothetical protein